MNAILTFALVTIFFFDNFYQASNSPNYGTFFAMREGFSRTDPSSDDTKNIIDESFHKCSNEKSCSKIAENVKIKKYKIVAVGEELSFENRDTRIWLKGMEGQQKG